MRKLIITLLCSTLLAACVGPTINQYQLVRLDKGLSATDVRTRLEQEPRGTVQASVAGRDFEVSRYLFNNGMQHDIYFLAYEKGRLVYWGYISDFRRHSDRVFSQVIDAALPQFGPLQ